MKQKKWIGILMTVVLSLTGTCGLAVYAREDSGYETFQEEVNLIQEGNFPDHVPVQTDTIHTYLTEEGHQTYAAAPQTARECLYQGLLNAESSIDLSSWQLSATELNTLFEDLINTSPELFYVVGSYRYNFSPLSAQYVANVMPSYTGSLSQIQTQQRYYNEQMEQIISLVNPAWSTLEKILFIHDYLAQHFEYDTTYVNHDAYTFFLEKKGVCQSYTLVFQGLMQLLNIDVSYASSTAMNHIWNLVFLNGNWYHIDNTWDDPVDDLYGRATHQYLLLSDTAIATQRGSSSSTHYNWSASYTCTDTTYDQFFWTSATSPFKYLNDAWYYVSFDSTAAYLYRYQFDTSSSTRLITLNRWQANGSSFYTTAFSGLDVYADDLYYNQSDGIYKYNPVSRQSTLICQAPQSLQIYGMRISQSTLTYYAAASHTVSGSIYSYTLPSTPSPSPSATPTATPSESPSVTPTVTPSESPSATPTVTPSESPSVTPTATPSSSPSATPTATPSESPIITPSPSPVPPALTIGDLTQDDTVDLQDAQVALKYALGILATPDESVLRNGDIDQDGSITLNDAQSILKIALGIPLES